MNEKQRSREFQRLMRYCLTRIRTITRDADQGVELMCYTAFMAAEDGLIRSETSCTFQQMGDYMMAKMHAVMTRAIGHRAELLKAQKKGEEKARRKRIKRGSHLKLVK